MTDAARPTPAAARPTPTAAALVGERIARHGLGGHPDDGVAAAVRRTTAVQAQDTAASYLGVRARSARCTEADVVRAVEVDRTLVRTWLMRGTIHLVAADDLHWLVRVIGASIQRRYRTRWRQLGLTDDLLDASLETLPRIFADGPLDRHQIRDALAARGVVFPGSDVQASTHMVLHACSTGLLCRGPDRGRTSTFVRTTDWVPAAATGPDGDDALAELARRYFAAYSPATAADFTTWAGLGAARAIALVRDELTPADVAGRPGFCLGEVSPQQGVRLLAAFDNYLIGYRHRAEIVASDVHGSIYQGGMIRPVLLIDGVAAGTWHLDRARNILTVQVFRPLRPPERTALDAEVADVGRFLARELTSELVDAP